LIHKNGLKNLDRYNLFYISRYRKKILPASAVPEQRTDTGELDNAKLQRQTADSRIMFEIMADFG
jgi:hypothetical protein